jgi:hypothetical protein
MQPKIFKRQRGTFGRQRDAFERALRLNQGYPLPSGTPHAFGRPSARACACRRVARARPVPMGSGMALVETSNGLADNFLSQAQGTQTQQKVGSAMRFTRSGYILSARRSTAGEAGGEASWCDACLHSLGQRQGHHGARQGRGGALEKVMADGATGGEASARSPRVGHQGRELALITGWPWCDGRR